MGKTLEILSK